MDDEEEQENELIALEAIYEDRQFMRSNDEPGGELRIYVELEEPFSIVFQDQEADGPKRAAKKIEDITVKYLPPIVLNFSYPSNYPSLDEPFFALSCKWLNESQLSILCKELDRLWENDGVGCVVMFEWTRFLTEEAISLLDIKSPLEIKNISRDGFQKTTSTSVSLAADFVSVDARAFQDVGSLIELRRCLVDYDNHEQTRQFNLNVFQCNVCFLEKFGDKCTSFYPCSHVFCNECMAEYFRVQIRDGAVKALTCPYDKCDSQATPGQVRNLVDIEMYEKYEKFLLQSTLACMIDIIYCPRTICQSPVLLENGSSMGMCPKCSFAFCTLCKRSYHGVAPCPMNEEELKKLRERYSKAGPEERLLLEKKYGRRNLKYAVEDAFSEAWILKNSKKCPHCKALIEKMDGCNKMTCFRCLGNFCWLCENGIPRSSPYTHFNDARSKCFNKLFEGVVMDDDRYEDEFD